MKWLGDASPVELGKEAFQQYKNDDVGGMAAELTYRFFLALFPFFIFLAALGGLAADVFNMDDPTGTVMDWIGDALPEDAAGVVETQLGQVVEGRDAGLLSFGIVAALWAASGGIAAFIKASNRAYGVAETRPIYKKYALALAITLLAGLFIVGAFLLFFVSQFFGQQIAERLGMGDAFTTVVDVARWPVVVLFLMIGVAFMYWIAPNVEGQRFHLVTPGAVAFIVVWIAATLAFGWYVSNMGNYQATYGALGGVIVALLWLYITSIVLILGIELNAMIEERVNPEVEHERRRKTAIAKGEPDPGRMDEAEREPQRERTQAERRPSGIQGRGLRGAPEGLNRARERGAESRRGRNGFGRPSLLPAAVAMFVTAVVARRIAR